MLRVLSPLLRPLTSSCKRSLLLRPTSFYILSSPTTTTLKSLQKATMSTTTSSSLPPVEGKIIEKIQGALKPAHLEVINESYKHKVPKGSETHFKVIVVSEAFEGKSLIDRHRMVNELLKEELATAVHALSITAKTPKQWEDSQVVANTPGCIRPLDVPMK